MPDSAVCACESRRKTGKGAGVRARENMITAGPGAEVEERIAIVRVSGRIAGLALAVFVLAGTAAWAVSESDWPLAVGEPVTLRGVMVNRVIDGYVFVRSVWAGGPRIPVFTNAAVDAGWTLDIQGHVQAAQGTPVTVAPASWALR